MSLSPIGARPAERTERTERPKVVAPTKTSVDKPQIRAAIASAYRAQTGTTAPQGLLDTLTAHVSHETAGGAMMHNFNFGGIKGVSPGGMTANTKTKEVLGGKEVSIVDGFRAYASIGDGAADYVSFMRTRFPGALDKAKSGDIAAFSHALKAGHYYTADEGAYTRALSAHAGTSASAGARSPELPTTDPTASLLTSRALCQINMALGDTAARILSPDEDAKH